MFTNKNLRLYCFSPAVMLITFVIEVGAALWLLLRYRTERTAQLMIATLVCLAVFQMAEYMVCEGAFGISSLDWARVGYVAITLLPPLGLHTGLAIAKRKNRALLAIAYGSGLVFAIFFLLVGHGMESQVCLGNYVIFNIAPYALWPYTVYYYGWLLVSVGLLWRYSMAISNANRKKALIGIAVGYASFLIPTTLANIIDPTTVAGIPSIMCGFAVILALILLFYVAPLILKKR